MFQHASRRAVAQAFSQGARRQLSSHGSKEEHMATAIAWKKRTIVALPLLGLLCLYNMQLHFAHEAHAHDHDEEHPKFAYQRILKKKYPWEANECNLFDLECKEKFYAKRAADALEKENKAKASVAAAAQKKVDDAAKEKKAQEDKLAAAAKAVEDAKIAAAKAVEDAKLAAEQKAAEAKAAVEAAAAKAKAEAEAVAAKVATEVKAEAATPETKAE
ncbi:hypothetical protein BASA81_015192 [Batrachochytrium salamandrivorans]|nr:hypothetical protein BASA81_015192 [Batrachochytrium salamandrivorans]